MEEFTFQGTVTVGNMTDEQRALFIESVSETIKGTVQYVTRYGPDDEIFRLYPSVSGLKVEKVTK